MSRSYNFFISDLHLDKDQTKLNDLFNQYCQELITWTKHKMSQLDINDLADSKDVFRVRLFILGDFLAKALGDEVEPWFKSQQDHLLELTALGIETYFTCGNRDFLLDINFCDKVGMLCVDENEVIEFMQDDLELNWRMANSYLTKKDTPNFNQAHLPELLSINSQNKLQAQLDARTDIAQVYSYTQSSTQAQASSPSSNHSATTDNKTSKPTTPIKLKLDLVDNVALSLLLCHGDNLCLSDRGYLKFRHYIRSGLIRFTASHTPHWFKNGIGNYLRKKSYQSQQLKPKDTATANAKESSSSNTTPATSEANHLARVKVTCIDVPYSFNLLSANNVHMGIFGHVHKQLLIVRNNKLGFLEQQFNLAINQFKQALTPKTTASTTNSLSKKTFKQRLQALSESGGESKIEQKFNEFSKGFYDPELDKDPNQAKALKHHLLADYTYADFSYDAEFVEQIINAYYTNSHLQKVVALPSISNFNEICGNQGLSNNQTGYKVLEQAKAVHLNFKPSETKQGTFWKISNQNILTSRILTQAGTTGFISSELLRQQQTLFSMADWQTNASAASTPISSIVLIHQLPSNNQSLESNYSNNGSDTNAKLDHDANLDANANLDASLDTNPKSTSQNKSTNQQNKQAQFCLTIFNDFAGFKAID